MKGRYRHVAVPCDDEGRRTWDVVRRGRTVAQGYTTRREARWEARRLDGLEAAVFSGAIVCGSSEPVREPSGAELWDAGL